LPNQFGQIAGDVAGAVVRQQARLVTDVGLVAARGGKSQFQRVGDVAGLHGRAQLPGDHVAREVVQDRRQVDPTPPDDLEVGEVGLPHLVGPGGLEMAAALDKIEAHPAMQLTPEAFAYQLRQAREAAQQQGSRDMSAAIQRVDAAGAGLERLTERQRTGREQVRQVAIMTAVGAVVGVIVWVGLSGPIARALPASWSVPERMAAATMRLDRWEAGARLMQRDNPQGWAQVAEGAKLERENRAELEDCWRAATRTGKAQRCTVTVGSGL
jgi:hypothetical protein